MSTINRTFSFPKDVDKNLHILIEKRQMSQFVVEAVRKGLKEKEDEIIQGYIDSCNDPGNIEVTKDWECTLNDGLGDHNDW